MKRRFIQDIATGTLVEVGLDQSASPRSAAVMGDLPSYESPIDGRPIHGRAARREDLKRHGCRPYEEGERQLAERFQVNEEAKMLRNVERTVEEFWYKASTQKRQELGRALEAGGDVRYTRKEP